MYSNTSNRSIARLQSFRFVDDISTDISHLHLQWCGPKSNFFSLFYLLLPRPRYIGGRGIVSIDFFVSLYLSFFLFFFLSFFLSLFISLFLCYQDYERTAEPICMKFSGKVEWPWDDLITILVNSEKPRDAAMRNTGTGFVVLSHHSLFVILTCDNDDKGIWKSSKWFESNQNHYWKGVLDQNENTFFKIWFKSKSNHRSKSFIRWA